MGQPISGIGGVDDALGREPDVRERHVTHDGRDGIARGKPDQHDIEAHARRAPDMQHDHQADAGDAEQRRHAHAAVHRFGRHRHAGDEVEADHREREAAHQHGEAGKLGRQIGAKPSHEAAQQELDQAGENRHAGDQREAALMRREDADREEDARERRGHQIAGAEVAPFEARQNRADAERQHTHRGDMLNGLARRMRRFEHQQRDEESDRGGDENMLERGHPEHEMRRAILDPINHAIGLYGRPGLPELLVLRGVLPKFEQSRFHCHGQPSSLADNHPIFFCTAVGTFLVLLCSNPARGRGLRHGWRCGRTTSGTTHGSDGRAGGRGDDAPHRRPGRQFGRQSPRAEGARGRVPRRALSSSISRR